MLKLTKTSSWRKYFWNKFLWNFESCQHFFYFHAELLLAAAFLILSIPWKTSSFFQPSLNIPNFVLSPCSAGVHRAATSSPLFVLSAGNLNFRSNCGLPTTLIFSLGFMELDWPTCSFCQTGLLCLSCESVCLSFPLYCTHKLLLFVAVC